jgi:hypothetical protein
MSRLLLIAVAAVLPLGLANPAQARGPGHSYSGSFHSTYHGGPSHSYSTGQSYFSRYGTRFSHGYYFGRNNFYWNRRCWSSRYGCYYYWNPYASGWYYWYAPGSCYYPISYIITAPPAGAPDGAEPPDASPVP